MHILSTKNLCNGMVLFKDVIVDNSVLLYKDTVLTNFLIEMLNKYNVCRVCIYDLEELHPALFNSANNILVRRYIDFLIMTFRSIFNTALIDNNSTKILLKFIDEYFLSNRNLLFESIVLRDNHCYTYEHSMNVTMYGLLIGLSEELTDKELKTLIYGCLLHDIGKLNIKNSILDKPDKLSDSEFAAIKHHPAYGVAHYEKVGIDDVGIRSIIVQHHEKLDGTGYPYGLKGSEISHLAKVAGVADIFDAVTSKRAYHKKRSIKDGIDILNNDSQNNKISKDEVSNLIKNLIIYPVNTMVRLSNGVTGFVLEDCRTMRPKIIDISTNNTFDLSKRSDLSVVEVIG